MKIIARNGKSSYLVRVSATHARVLNLSSGVLFPPFLADSILARGYWDAYDGTAEELDELLPRVRSFETWDAYLGSR